MDAWAGLEGSPRRTGEKGTRQASFSLPLRLGKNWPETQDTWNQASPRPSRAPQPHRGQKGPIPGAEIPHLLAYLPPPRPPDSVA